MLDSVGVEAGDQEQLNTGNKVAEVNLLMVKVRIQIDYYFKSTTNKLIRGIVEPGYWSSSLPNRLVQCGQRIA